MTVSVQKSQEAWECEFHNAVCVGHDEPNFTMGRTYDIGPKSLTHESHVLVINDKGNSVWCPENAFEPLPKDGEVVAMMEIP
jgi:hypothetical protein